MGWKPWIDSRCIISSRLEKELKTLKTTEENEHKKHKNWKFKNVKVWKPTKHINLIKIPLCMSSVVYWKRCMREQDACDVFESRLPSWLIKIVSIYTKHFLCFFATLYFFQACYPCWRIARCQIKEWACKVVFFCHRKWNRPFRAFWMFTRRCMKYSKWSQ